MGLGNPISHGSRVLLFGSLGVLLALGLPMAFCTGSLAVHLPVPVRQRRRS